MENIEHAIYVYRKKHRNWADLTFRAGKIRKWSVEHNMQYMRLTEMRIWTIEYEICRK
jgi:hypothetical protein